MTGALDTGALDTSHRRPQDSTGLMLWRVTNSWQRTIRAALEPYDLTHVQFVLLAVLASLEGSSPVTQRALAEHAATDPMMTSQVLRTLETKGLVERLVHPTDRRARIVSPTEAGIRLVNRANRAVELADKEYFAALGDAAPAFTRALVDLSAANQTPEAGRPGAGPQRGDEHPSLG